MIFNINMSNVGIKLMTKNTFMNIFLFNRAINPIHSYDPVIEVSRKINFFVLMAISNKFSYRDNPYA